MGCCACKTVDSSTTSIVQKVEEIQPDAEETQELDDAEEPQKLANDQLESEEGQGKEQRDDEEAQKGQAKEDEEAPGSKVRPLDEEEIQRQQLKSIRGGSNALRVVIKQLTGELPRHNRTHSHRSMFGHSAVLSFLTQKLGMTLLCHEETFYVPETFNPDLCFLWNFQGNPILVISEVSAMLKGNYEKLHRQCYRALNLLGSRHVVVTGFIQRTNLKLELVLCGGRMSSTLVALIKTKRGGTSITVGNRM